MNAHDKFAERLCTSRTALPLLCQGPICSQTKRAFVSFETVSSVSESIQQKAQQADTIPCHLCPFMCGSHKALKAHFRLKHDFRYTSREVAVDGMPQCQYCQVKFSKWTVFQTHVKHLACEGLRKADSQQRANEAPALTPDVEARVTQRYLDLQQQVEQQFPSLPWHIYSLLVARARSLDVRSLHLLCGQWVASPGH